MQIITNGADNPGLDAYFTRRFGPPPAQAKLGWSWSAELSSDCTDPNAPASETLRQYAEHDVKHHSYYVGTSNTGAGNSNSGAPNAG